MEAVECRRREAEDRERIAFQRVEELAEHDCPPGHHLQEKVMFGCCPACVKYLDYAQPCPGLLWLEDTSNEVALVYGEVSEFDDMSHWPDSLVG